MSKYSVTYLEGDAVKTIYFEHEMALTRLLADITDKDALIIPSGAKQDGRVSEGRRAVMASRIVSLQDDPA